MSNNIVLQSVTTIAAHAAETTNVFPSCTPLKADIRARMRQHGERRVSMAEAVLRVREVRSGILNPDYFGEAAFNMLLDLYISRKRGRMVYQNDAYIASMVPATTAYRWLRTLQRDGMVDLSGDETDRRRGIVELTEAGMAQVETLLDAMMQIVEEMPAFNAV